MPAKKKKEFGLRNLETMNEKLKSDSEKVLEFQSKIYQKAKQEKEYSFYILYDKVRDLKFLRYAYKLCKENKGRGGIDGIEYTKIEETGVEEFLKAIAKELEEHTYKAQAVLRVNIPKGNGKTRPLGIPTIKDRVVQMSVKLVIEPIFEADFEDSSYGFRPVRSAHDAVKEIKKKLIEGKVEVYDADLSAYFDTIPHNELMILVKKRISDKYILNLIKMWLKSPVYENKIYTGGKKNKVGIPQGGVISPLLANIYLHLLDKAVNRAKGIFRKYGIEIVRYADDFILMGKRIPREVIEYLKEILSKMKLKVNEEKTHMLNGYKERFNFLGFTFRYSQSLYQRERKYWNIEPSIKSQKKLRGKIKEYLSRNGHKASEILVKDLNAMLRGWLNYFSIEKVSYPAKAKRSLRNYLYNKLTRSYKRKSQRKCKLCSKGVLEYMIKRYGLIDVTQYKSNGYTVKV